MTAGKASMAISALDEARILELPRHGRADGEVVVADAGSGVPFAIARLFTLRAPQNAQRGQHAHRLCSQFMICVHGMVDVILDDGAARKTFALDRSNRALLVPPMIWNTVVFKEDWSVVAVLCDRIYEAEDYISDYAAFVRERRGLSA